MSRGLVSGDFRALRGDPGQAVQSEALDGGLDPCQAGSLALDAVQDGEVAWRPGSGFVMVALDITGSSAIVARLLSMVLVEVGSLHLIVGARFWRVCKRIQPTRPSSPEIDAPARGLQRPPARSDAALHLGWRLR